MHYNIKMYPWYYAATSFLAWLPVFFLYFSSYLSLKDVLLLEAIYYITVVILEVPTGYFSDLVGRKKTLVLGAVFLCLACIFFYIGSGFWSFVIGQIAFALHMSLVSGTNTVFHFESLQELKLDHEYGDREAYVNKFGMVAGGTSALVGGFAAYSDLKMAYVVTFVAAIVALLITLRFEEPKGGKIESNAIRNIFGQLDHTIRYLRARPIGWIFAYWGILFCVTHVPYEFYQPYLKILSEHGLLFGWSVPIVSGILYAGARYAGAIGAAYSMVLSRKFGLVPYFLFNLLMINLIVFAMGWALNSVIILLVLLRSLPYAAIKAPVNALLTPRIDSGQRATFHSMMSLTARLSFFLTSFWVILGLSPALPQDGHFGPSWHPPSKVTQK